MKASRPELSVWVVTGDGDGLSIGGNHLLHTIRRNVDLQILLFNNRVYGLTKGQYSPTSRLGMRTKSTPEGSIDYAIDPIAFALGAGATFVGRAIDVDAPHLQDLLRRAHNHRGTAFIEILQNCPVYNDDEWLEVEDRNSRVEAALILEDGNPLVFGPPERLRGIRIKDGIPTVVKLQKGEDPIEAGVAIHNERYETPAYAFALASLNRPDFPLPIGIFRAVEKPPYGALLQDQVDNAIAVQGAGTLRGLLNSGDVWSVEPNPGNPPK
jgi:2-oxoglutarate ferredoxin oxidoreductase subunit beta